jgi:hypothetical protein
MTRILPVEGKHPVSTQQKRRKEPVAAPGRSKATITHKHLQFRQDHARMLIFATIPRERSHVPGP